MPLWSIRATIKDLLQINHHFLVSINCKANRTKYEINVKLSPTLGIQLLIFEDNEHGDN